MRPPLARLNQVSTWEQPAFKLECPLCARSGRPPRAALDLNRNWCGLVGLQFPANLPKDIRRSAFHLQARLMRSRCRWSVPQQPPSTLMCGKRRKRSPYCAPSSSGLPGSSSVALSSSAWLRLDEFARSPRNRVSQAASLSNTARPHSGSGRSRHSRKGFRRYVNRGADCRGRNHQEWLLLSLQRQERA